MSPKIPLTLSFAKVANFLSVVGIIGSLILLAWNFDRIKNSQ